MKKSKSAKADGSAASAEAQGKSVPPVGRREMIIKTLTLSLVGAICLLEKPSATAAVEGAEGLAGTYAASTAVQSRVASKPQLTAINLNLLIRRVGENPRSVRNRAAASRAARDWRAFIASEFQLTNAQRRNLNGLPSELVAKVQRAVKQAAAGRASLVVSASPRPAGDGALAGGREGVAIMRMIDEVGGKITCSFGADCGDWDCEIGPGSGIPPLPPEPGPPLTW
jgi:hypothetical protein